jgi:hypothetical protein
MAALLTVGRKPCCKRLLATPRRGDEHREEFVMRTGSGQLRIASIHRLGSDGPSGLLILVKQ